jgi:hypothetical protein
MKVDPQPDIRPCPLCGGAAFLKTNIDASDKRVGSHKQFWVKCDSLNCGITLDPLPDQTAIVQRWNKRVGSNLPFAYQR